MVNSSKQPDLLGMETQMNLLKQLTYRGFEINEQSNGGWVVIDPSGVHQLSHNGGRFLTDEDAMNAVDAHKRAVRAQQEQ